MRKKNLKAIGAANDLTMETRVNILQQKFAELFTALQEAGIKSELSALSRAGVERQPSKKMNPTGPRRARLDSGLVLFDAAALALLRGAVKLLDGSPRLRHILLLADVVAVEHRAGSVAGDIHDAFFL